MIGVVDYGMGNLGSILNMLRRLEVPVLATDRPERLTTVERLILPGVGAFDAGMRSLRRLGLEPVLTRRVVQENVPVLGICLGMQLMTRGSAEGEQQGLGWVDGDARHLSEGAANAASLKVPHMGWNYVYPTRRHPLCSDLSEDSRYYFAHTYRVVCADPADVLMESYYQEIGFHSAFAHQNMVGVQFHPEKSHRYGMQLLKSFASWSGQAPRRSNG